METDQWLTGWREIGKYLVKSSRTVQRWACIGLPFLRDPGGRPIAKKSQIDEFILEMNQRNYDIKNWQDKGIGKAE